MLCSYHETIPKVLQRHGRVLENGRQSELERSIGLVADASIQSTKTGITIDYAVRSGMPTLVLNNPHMPLDWESYPTPNLQEAVYSSEEQLSSILDSFAQKTLSEHPPLSGAYIVIEGCDGNGKSTQFKRLTDYLRTKRLDVIALREPGATRLGESVRAILLDPGRGELSTDTEMLLFQTARLALFDEVIIPVMRSGKIVLADRSYISTLSYQGYGGEAGLQSIDLLSKFATRRITPDLCIVLDVEPEEGLRRVRTHEFGKKDRIEQKSLGYHTKVREGYKAIAKNRGFHLIDTTTKDSEEVWLGVQSIVDKFLATEFS